MCATPKENTVLQTRPPEARRPIADPPFCLAMALLNGRLGIDDFQDHQIHSPALRSQMDKVTAYVHPKLVGPAVERAVVMEIETVDGRTISKTRMKPTGGGGAPLSWETVAAKFRACTQEILSREDQDRIEADIQQLDRIANIKNTVQIIARKPIQPAVNF